ncbi:YafY family transcriptional regulator [Yersinia canariae]|uniref:YafY family transcriptional regulator n=1 Tax=Yersinia canariae TaxID=2607663 RepID=A0A857F4C8_9GAMM|nr:YafY family protein [Yersinia canariae]QHB34054.1 YafY family transcriptional regulator [Yersinia canariae]
MSRSQRLLDLIQILRRHRYPVTGAALAEELAISVRTLYRDIATLQQQGADITGEPGLGYVLRPGFMLPPLMFSEEEIEALVLGSRWVSYRGDTQLSSAARNALAKIAAVLPADLRDELDASTLLIGPAGHMPDSELALPLLRRAIRAERKVDITYRDLKGVESCRRIWPFAIGFFEQVRVVVAWCELRQTIRNFRADRISAITLTDQRYPQRRHLLLKQWREAEGISDQSLLSGSPKQ